MVMVVRPVQPEKALLEMIAMLLPMVTEARLGQSRNAEGSMVLASTASLLPTANETCTKPILGFDGSASMCQDAASTPIVHHHSET